MSANNAPKYRQHFEKQILPKLCEIAGYVSADLISSAGSDEVEIIVTTRWQSMDAIRAFAGADVESAVVADEMKPLFIQWQRCVRHYELLVADLPHRLR